MTVSTWWGANVNRQASATAHQGANTRFENSKIRSVLHCWLVFGAKKVVHAAPSGPWKELIGACSRSIESTGDHVTQNKRRMQSVFHPRDNMTDGRSVPRQRGGLLPLAWYSILPTAPPESLLPDPLVVRVHIFSACVARFCTLANWTLRWRQQEHRLNKKRVWIRLSRTRTSNFSKTR